MENTDENTLFARNELEKKLTLCKVSLENDSAENNEEKFGSSGEFSADVIGDDTVDNDGAVDSTENGVQQGKREISFVIGEYHKNVNSFLRSKCYHDFFIYFYIHMYNFCTFTYF